MDQSMKARENQAGLKDDSLGGPFIPSLLLFSYFFFQAASQVHGGYVILTFTRKCCNSQDRLGCGAVTNIPTISGLKQQRVISCSCYIRDLGQPWPLLYVVLTL